MTEPIATNFAERRRQIVEARTTVSQAVERVETAATVRRNQVAAEAEYNARYRALLGATSNLSHQLVLNSPKRDWTMAFSLLVNHTLAYLALGQGEGNLAVVSAMVRNLQSLGDEVRLQFPDQIFVLAPWQQAIAALSEPTEVPVSNTPHPNVDSLREWVLMIRNCGTRESGFTSYFAPSDAGIHVIRPPL